MYKFESQYPQIDTSGLYTKRNEISHVLEGLAFKPLSTRIEKIYPGSLVKSETMVTTYFESVYIYEPEFTCVLRFRQRISFPKHHAKFSPPPTWSLSGPGVLEIKLRSKDRLKVLKSSTFLSGVNGEDLYSLLKITMSPSPQTQRLTDFINKANSRQILNTNPISPASLIAVSQFLYPQFTRISLRTTYHVITPKFSRITLDTHPTYYAYPIEHSAHQKGSFKSKYTGFVMEKPSRTKVEIKSLDVPSGINIEKNLSRTIKKFVVPGEKLTKTPFIDMTEAISQKLGKLVNERPGREVEIKANVTKSIDVKRSLNLLRNMFLKLNKSKYFLFPSFPRIESRDKLEKNRAFFGWQDRKGHWIEAVKITRLNKQGIMETGFAAVLKQKGNQPSSFRGVMDRTEKKKFLLKDLSNHQILKKFRPIYGPELRFIGEYHKIKFAFILQDQDGRCFNVSLDEITLPKSSHKLQQFEVEYLYTSKIGKSKKPHLTLEKSCEYCAQYLRTLLRGLGILVKPTTLRKIDFVGSLSGIQ